MVDESLLDEASEGLVTMDLGSTLVTASHISDYQGQTIGIFVRFVDLAGINKSARSAFVHELFLPVRKLPIPLLRQGVPLLERGRKLCPGGSLSKDPGRGIPFLRGVQSVQEGH